MLPWLSRVVPALVVVAASATAARADNAGFLRFVTGGSVPVADGTWRESVALSPKLAAAVGGFVESNGGMLSVDWAYQRFMDEQVIVSSFAQDARGQRIRIVGHALHEWLLDERLVAVARAGIGWELLPVRYETRLGTITSTQSTMDGGVALEIGAAAWFSIGPGFQVGGELAVPLAIHSRENSGADTVGFNYTSADFDLLVGVRFTSRD